MSNGLWVRPIKDYVLCMGGDKGWYVTDRDYLKHWNEPFGGWKWSDREGDSFILPSEMMEPMR